MSTPEQYQGEVEAVLIQAESFVSSDQMREPWNMAEHGEPAEALAMLAWVISENQISVDPSIVDRIRRLSDGFVDPADLPSDLDRWSVRSAT